MPTNGAVAALMRPMLALIDSIPMAPGVIISLFLGMVCGDSLFTDQPFALEQAREALRMAAIGLSVTMAIAAIWRLTRCRGFVQPYLLALGIAATATAIVVSSMGKAHLLDTYWALVAISMTALAIISAGLRKAIHAAHNRNQHD